MNDCATQWGLDFELLYSLRRELLHRTAYRILGDKAEAEDAVQTAFLRAWQQPAAFRGGNLESWLVCLVKNCSIDMLRRKSREAARSSEGRDAVESEIVNVENMVLHQLDCDRLRIALGGLREDQFALVHASFYGGMPHHHLAKHANLPLGTVKTRIRSGLATLRKAIAS